MHITIASADTNFDFHIRKHYAFHFIHFVLQRYCKTQYNSSMAFVSSCLYTASITTSYHLQSSHRFLSTWGAVMLKKKVQAVFAFRCSKGISV